jgi:hypothetical protein
VTVRVAGAGNKGCDKKGAGVGSTGQVSSRPRWQLRACCGFHTRAKQCMPLRCGDRSSALGGVPRSTECAAPPLVSLGIDAHRVTRQARHAIRGGVAGNGALLAIRGRVGATTGARRYLTQCWMALHCQQRKGGNACSSEHTCNWNIQSALFGPCTTPDLRRPGARGARARARRLRCCVQLKGSHRGLRALLSTRLEGLDGRPGAVDHLGRGVRGQRLAGCAQGRQVSRCTL